MLSINSHGPNSMVSSQIKIPETRGRVKSLSSQLPRSQRHLSVNRITKPDRSPQNRQLVMERELGKLQKEVLKYKSQTFED